MIINQWKWSIWEKNWTVVYIMYCLFLQGYDSLDHTNTKHQPETMELLQEWRALLDSSSNKPGREKLVDLSHLLYLIILLSQIQLLFWWRGGHPQLVFRHYLHFIFFLADLAKGHVSFCYHLASVRRKLSHLNLLLWNPWTKPNQNIYCSYMEMSSLTYIPVFSVKFFFQPVYSNSLGILWDKNHI